MSIRNKFKRNKFKRNKFKRKTKKCIGFKVILIY